MSIYLPSLIAVSAFQDGFVSLVCHTSAVLAKLAFFVNALSAALGTSAHKALLDIIVYCLLFRVWYVFGSSSCAFAHIGSVHIFSSRHCVFE